MYASSPQSSRRDADDPQIDIVALGIVTAAIILFVATGSAIGPAVVRSLAGEGPGPDNFLLNAFLLNIAIIIFGWSRYRELCEEIIEGRAAEREARHLAETDSLTGFHNRRSFNHSVEALIDRAVTDGKAVAVLMVDLDNFKQVNDYNGHATGDRLLVECARRITAALPQNTVVGRIGGDEFAVAMAFDRLQSEGVDRTAAALVQAIAEGSRSSSTTIEVTASIGLARAESRTTSAQALLEMADVAMYHAKRQGRNQFSWYEPQMAHEMRFRADLEAGIRAGIPRGEFVPFYEQQVDLQTGELTGFEMLARWDSPQFGIVAPDIFIPVAEEIGAIAELSRSVIAQALEDARLWDSRLTLAVNISPIQLRDPWFAQKLLRMLVEANFPPQRLEIEITESCLHQNLGQVRTLVTSLKNQGVRISLDDFGTGYSSIGQLKQLPFDRIKIDRSFVSSMLDDEDSAAIVKAVATLGEGLHMPVTAEGIDTQDVLDRLRQYGSITGQGYLYGRPRRAAELGEWLSEEGPADMPVPQTPQAPDTQQAKRA
ncbi:putative bifunctional diguanylate cyclase/phosphodiesterase [Novosphingobium guangzhouense]|uniref:Diguanylate cyclase n=1 Tax=Novosphingobium guangzhouense TaxID=1850347 RepID=A0A2K2G0R1_9SPHN|nr:EAL domain-containing protein [Novosphingobium guangzhouense]PNU04639.1 diguanylate cyclase [Novosphingobium guangzhouense]